jgi:hypothetical protein
VEQKDNFKELIFSFGGGGGFNISSIYKREKCMEVVRR